ncbi:MarR family winged helix-turn-helix transcriptional regulator [Iodobacter fluviatilis]|jgi:DNA-binding MarR family transcriptional regulator|uniref:MarR family transcriptional regulator n=1 Tax=Iodobacter fluviatilis TaxID=537 RepID=A0A7G3GD05_9NEIS|nr:MarR family winged helix-turn-helix transcriptional regulator [Iodobacter fluviatilis]QBC45206.1 MarR family transcriptional regulator [Iodobacter fluviatilis]
MDNDQTSPWRDTPARSERVISAISRIASVLRTGAWQFATAEGLNPTQLDVLEILHGRREGVRLSWVAQQLGVTTATASDSVTSLSSKGLLEKVKAADDGRAVALKLTLAGHQLAQRLTTAMQFASVAVEGLPESAQNELFSTLLALIGQLQRAERFPEIRACVSCKYFAAGVHADSAAPHHCRLVDAALPKALLRLDCPEHIAADELVVSRNWLDI